MSDNERADISDRLTRLETVVDEKWNSHDKRADERWSDLMDKLHEMGKKVDARPCHEHSENMLLLNSRVKAIEGWINIAGWAISVIYVALIGVIISRIF
jgi:hypothetical protein